MISDMLTITRTVIYIYVYIYDTILFLNLITINNSKAS